MGDREAIAYARDWLIGRDPLAIRPFVRAMLSGGLPPYEPQMSPDRDRRRAGGVGRRAASRWRCATWPARSSGRRSTTCSAGRSATGSGSTSTGAASPIPSDLGAWRALAERVIADGFRDFKFDAEWIAPEVNRDPWNRQMRSDQVRLTFERLAVVREVAGPDAEIALDGHMSFDVETAIRLAKALEPLDLKWFEDPVPILNLDAQKRVRDESPIPICAGEMLVADQFREMIDRRAVDIVHPDLLFVGGLHEGKKVADYADLNGIPLAIHNNGSAMNTVAEAHLGGGLPQLHRPRVPLLGREVDRPGRAPRRRAAVRRLGPRPADRRARVRRRDRRRRRRALPGARRVALLTPARGRLDGRSAHHRRLSTIRRRQPRPPSTRGSHHAHGRHRPPAGRDLAPLRRRSRRSTTCRSTSRPARSSRCSARRAAARARPST